MYQVLHDTNNVTDSGCHWHCVRADHSSRDQGQLLAVWQCCFKFRTVHCCWALFEIKTATAVWYVPCKRRCVPRFTKLKHRHRHHKWHNDRPADGSDAVSPLWKKSLDSLSRNSVSVSDSQSVNRTTLFSLSQMNYRITRITDKIMTVKCVTTIPCIDPADLSINISD